MIQLFCGGLNGLDGSALTFWGIKGAEVPLREVGDEYPPYRNLFILKKR